MMLDGGISTQLVVKGRLLVPSVDEDVPLSRVPSYVGISASR